MIKIFKLNRIKDYSGISGTGIVAEGVVFSDGVAVVRWVNNRHPSTNIYNSIEDVMSIHGHGISTQIEFEGQVV